MEILRVEDDFGNGPFIRYSEGNEFSFDWWNLAEETCHDPYNKVATDGLEVMFRREFARFKFTL